MTELAESLARASATIASSMTTAQCLARSRAVFAILVVPRLEEAELAQTKAQRSAAAKKAAATRQRNAAKKSAQDVKTSAGGTARGATNLAKAAGSTALSAARSVAKRADAARGGRPTKRKSGTRKHG